jgi:hypothetical protein
MLASLVLRTSSHTPTFVKTGPTDAELATEQEDLFDFYIKLKIVTITTMPPKLFRFYFCNLKSIMYASRGESPDSEDLYFCKSQSMLSSF